MIEYIGGTVGLNCSVNGRAILTRIEYSRVGKKIALQAVSGRSLAALHGVSVAKITQEEFDDRPRDAYNDLVEAKWAFGKLGLRITNDEADDMRAYASWAGQADSVDIANLLTGRVK